MKPLSPPPARRLAKRRVFDDLVYAQCWEDPQMDREAFHAGPGDVLFTITSGGCNALTFLLDDPARVIALDFNPHQNHVLDLKMAAFLALDHDEVLQFLGVRESGRRLLQYSEVRRFLRPDSRAWWDSQEDKVAMGALHSGRYERYLALVRTWLKRLLGSSLVEDMARTNDPAARLDLFRRRWDGFRWRLVTDVLLSRFTMSRLFDKGFFTHVEQDVPFGAQFRLRIERALERQSARENPFLAYVLLGRFLEPDGLPDYLRPENFATIRSRLSRVEMHSGPCQEFLRTLPDASVSRFNFTNIFEWMPESDYEAILAETVRVARDRSVLTYRNLFVPRSRPPAFADRIAPSPSLAKRLHEGDRSFLYRAYVVESVTKEAAPCAA